MLYSLYEMNHATLQPWRALADVNRRFWQAPGNPMGMTPAGRGIAASCEMFERITRRYGKPSFDIETVQSAANAKEHFSVVEEAILTKPFCTLLHFRKIDFPAKKPQKKLLIVAPMSGHYATLLRGTVQALLPFYDVYITDWTDARTVPLWRGNFDLEDFIDYLVDMFRHLGNDLAVMAVCQPSVPVLLAVSLLSAHNDPDTPKAMVLMGGPIDTRRNPTSVNHLAQERGVSWFSEHVVMSVPFPNPGFMRRVCPGFLQLGGFMTMNLDRHIDEHREFYWHLVEGDGDSAEKHREFYDEYMSVMDLTAEFYLQTIEKVFVRHDLPNNQWRHRGELLTPNKITKTALMTIEGERDDISGVGQTQAAHDLCSALPAARKRHHLQMGVGHYGVFNGSRFRAEIVPKIVEFLDAQL